MRSTFLPSTTLFLLLAAAVLCSRVSETLAGDASEVAVRSLLDNYCLSCHGGAKPEAGYSLDDVDFQQLALHRDALERAVSKLRSRQMPPADAEQPSLKEHLSAYEAMVKLLDEFAESHPDPGQPEALRRLTRTEYRNAIRDLLAIDIDSELLPADSVSHGFDNITVSDLSPALMNRYVMAAQAIGKQAMGIAKSPQGKTFRVRPDITQDDHLPGLPIGTRGGLKVETVFLRSGKYRIDVRLARDRNEHVEGLSGRHVLEVHLDGKVIESFVIERAPNEDHSRVDEHLNCVFPASAGKHELVVTFVKQSSSLMETMRQPLQSRFNVHRHPRQAPAVFEVSLLGPIDTSDDSPGLAEKTHATALQLYDSGGASANADQPDDVRAQRILAQVMRKAFRRPVAEEELAASLKFYTQERSAGAGFDDSMAAALSSVLVSPNFLFRIEAAPDSLASQSVVNIPDLELASRLSFFLWSSLPDEELLAIAEEGRLRESGELARQTLRMLQDPRSQSLIDNFASQWLFLANLESITPDARLFPDFDDNLRQAMQTETALLVQDVVRENRSVLDLLESDYTYLNERLAKHYGVSGVYGARFRKVPSAKAQHRGGILRHASLLTVTSYANRTSPVIRGNWILANLLASPPPPPPANVPVLDNTVSADLPIRQRLAAHRDNEACAGCHQLIDPIGFALENYDAIGRWREVELGEPIDSTGALPGGSEFAGVVGLEQALLAQPDWFAEAFTRKLMTYALGRVLEPSDGAAIRKIVRHARQSDYRFSAIVDGIVESVPFQMRKVN